MSNNKLITDSQIVESCFAKIKELIVKNILSQGDDFEIISIESHPSDRSCSAYIKIRVIGFFFNFFFTITGRGHLSLSYAIEENFNKVILDFNDEDKDKIIAVFRKKFNETETERKITERAKKMQELAVLESELNLELA